MRKITALLLILLAFSLVGCENVEYYTPPPPSSEPPKEFYEELESQLPEVTPPEIEEERDFVILTDSPGTFIYDELTPDSVSSAITQRNSFLEMKYGVNIIVEEVSPDELADRLREAQENGKKACDMISVSATETAKLMEAGLLGDLNKLPGFNLDSGYFDSDLAKPLATNSSLYMLADPSCYTFDNATVMFYNRNLVKAPEGGEDVETLALQGKWTWERFNEYCRSSVPDAYSSKGNDIDEDDFAYGFGYEPEKFVADMLASCEQKLVADSYKKPVELAFEREEMKTLGEYFRTIYNDRGRFPLTGNDARQAFEEGRIAFFCAEMGYIHSLRDGSAKGTEFGFIPMPKMSEEQVSYHCLLNPESSRVISIPKSTETADEATKAYVSAIISGICAAGGVTIKEAYVNTLLGLYLTTNNETLLVDAIAKSITFDFASVYGSALEVIYEPTILPMANFIVDGLSMSSSGRKSFKQYCETNFQ